MISRHELHRIIVIRTWVKSRWQQSARAIRLIVIPAGERMREPHDYVLVVSRDGLTSRVKYQRPVGMHAIEPDREELQDLPCIVLVRDAAARLVRLIIAPHV